MKKRFPVSYSDPRWWWGGDYIPACFDCTHFQGRIEGKLRCKAFPDGIPLELIKQGIKHDTPYPGDHDIRFKQYTKRRESN